MLFPSSTPARRLPGNAQTTAPEPRTNTAGAGGLCLGSPALTRLAVLAPGVVTEVFGEPGSGKTTLGLHAAASAEQAGAAAVFLDAEHAVFGPYAAALGVEKSVLIQPERGQGGVAAAIVQARRIRASLVVVDTLAALYPEALDEPAFQRLAVGGLRALCRLGVPVLVLNQTRVSGRLAMDASAGGRVVRRFASVRLELVVDSIASDRRSQLGSCRVVKSPLALPGERVRFRLWFGKGISRTLSKEEGFLDEI